MKKTRVAILGAGPTGLGLAQRLLAREDGLDLDVEVIEARDHVGGLAASFEYGGVTFDHGSHRLHPSIDPRILTELEGLLEGRLFQRTRRGRIGIEGRWVQFPVRIFDALWRLPLRSKWGVFRDSLVRSTPREGPDTYAGVLQRTLGRTLCESFYFPMSQKLWGVAPDEIDVEQARRRVSAQSPLGIVGKALLRLLRLSGQGGFFHYPESGFGEISKALAADVQRRGGKIRLGQPVRELRREPKCWGLGFDGDEETIQADLVFSTIPLPALVKVLQPNAPDEVQSTARELRSRGVILVCLVLAREQWSRWDAHYLPARDIVVSRVSEPKNYQPAGPPSGRTGLCVEIPCDRDDQLWRRTDEDLLQLACDELDRAGLPHPEPLVDGLVRRLPSVYPVYDLQYRERLARLQGYVDRQPSLVTLGRQGLFAHDNTHHALAMAWAAAECVGGTGAWNENRWKQETVAFASHVVED